jgi:UDP-glucuronate 4-epimerase
MKYIKNILITGVAGFVGFHLTKKLLAEGYNVDSIDNINDYYDQNLKKDRIKILTTYNNFTFNKIDLTDKTALAELFTKNKYDIIIHLAAQAGVRYSIENPDSYVQSNLVGFMNILEMARTYSMRHFIFASSSSVYGLKTETPFSEDHCTDSPVSLYAATKKSNEVLAYSYSHLYNIPITGLRFFTVYGPWGRPDMAYFSFTKNIINSIPINLFNNGNMLRDFTYIDDVVNAIAQIIYKPTTNTKDEIPYNIYNIGNNSPIKLQCFIETLENIIGKKAIINHLPIQPGDVYQTFASIDKIKNLINFAPSTSIENGLQFFVDWYKKYYNIEI